MRKAGITTIAKLERRGPVAAYRLVKQRHPKASLNLLWSLAVGLKGQDWRQLSHVNKQQLRKELGEE